MGSTWALGAHKILLGVHKQFQGCNVFSCSLHFSLVVYLVVMFVNFNGIYILKKQAKCNELKVHSDTLVIHGAIPLQSLYHS